VQTSIQESLTAKINALLKPNTNIQILQQSLLLKHAPSYDYLRRNSEINATALRLHYQRLLAQVFSVYFTEYTNVLVALLVRPLLPPLIRSFSLRPV